MKMRRASLGFLISIALISGVIGQRGFVFEGEARRRHKPGQTVQYDEASQGVVTRPGINPAIIESIFQIPIAVLQGTSSAAQSWRPDNGDTINKVFDIPVQTLQAVGNFIKDRVEQQSGNSVIRNQSKLQRHQHRLEEHSRLRDLQRVKRQQQYDDGQARRHHSFYDPLAWTDAFADLLVGHGGLFSGHGGQGGHGNRLGGHNDFFGGNKKKKKKKKPHNGGNGGHLQNLGSHFGNHGSGGHFGSHSSHFGGNGHKPIGQQILGGNGHIYQVHENLQDIAPPADLFPWNRRPRIQNKIAPKFQGEGRSL